MRRGSAVVASRVAFLVAFVALSIRVPLDVGPRDTGELTAASFVLGVAHPTGSPLCLLLEGLATVLPLGTVVFRHGLVMALATALAAGLMTAVAFEDERWHPGPAVAAALGGLVGAAVVAPTLLRAGTMTEVYAPTALLVAAAIAVASSPTPRPGALGALVGLSLSAHPTARLLVPMVAVAPLFRGLSARGVSSVGAPVVGALVTAPLALYVPVAALRSPPIAWGDPRTAGAFFRHFWASDLRATFAARTEGHLLADAAAYAKITLLDLGVPLLSLGLVGLALGLRRGGTARIVAALVLADLAYAVKVNPMGIVDRQVGHVALLGLAALAVIPLLGLARRGAARLLAPALAFTGVVGVVLRAAPELVGDEGALVARVFGVPGALARLPPRAVLICDGDDTCGGLLYAQLVEGARPDVGVLPRVFAERPTYLAARLGPVRDALARALSAKDRSVFVQGGDKPYPFPTTVTVGLPFLEVGPPRRVDALGPLLRTDRALAATGLPPLSRWVLAQAHLGPVSATMASGDFAQAEAIASLGLTLDPSIPALWNNRAVARASRGALVEALADVDEALRLDPTRVPALVNRAAWLLGVGDLSRAAVAVADLSQRCLDCAQARILAAALAVREGRAPPSTLSTLTKERAARPDLWCRAHGLAGLPAPADCAR